jgi:hypothetical protein
MGGLGNQLFCYAAARRLAYANSVELAIDHVSGFARDRLYHRKYALDHFAITARKATANERMEPFERIRRRLVRIASKVRRFEHRSYVEQIGREFDSRILELKVNGTLYLDGLWQSENYFKDIESIIRADLEISPPIDSRNRSIAAEIQKSNAIALHVRWFDAPGSEGRLVHNIARDYYQRAIERIEARVETPKYFLFSDQPEAAVEKLRLSNKVVVPISHNNGDENAYADLWLMLQCKHFIIANSTFSWWGAWLCKHSDKCIISPGEVLGDITAWGFPGLIPESWIVL